MGSKESSTANLFELYSKKTGTSVDLRTGAPRIEYRESMIDDTVRISAAIVDTGNAASSDRGSRKTISAAESLKLMGDDNKVLFKYTDAAGNVLDFSKDTDLRLSHKNFETRTFKGSSFIIQIVSKEFLDNKLLENRVLRRYSGKISSSVETILKKDLKTDKNLYISETINSFSDYGLRKEPFDVILELQQISIPNLPKAKGNTAGYFFWQTSKGFHFKSPDEIFNGKPTKRYIYNFKVDEKIPVGYTDKILEYTAKRVIDVEKQMEFGTFGAVTETFNYATQEYVKNPDLISKDMSRILSGEEKVTYGDYSSKPTNFFASPVSIGMNYGTGESVENQLEKSKQENFSVSETIAQSIQNYRQRLNFMIEVKIPADFSLHAGDIIECDLPELSSAETQVKSPKDSGIYMILELCHYISPTKTYTGLVLVRDSFGVKV